MNPHPLLFLLLPLLLTLGACTLAFDTADYPYIGRASDQGGADAGRLDMRPPDTRDMMGRDLSGLDLSKGKDLADKKDARVSEDMAPPPFVPKILISEIMIHPDDDTTEEWVEIVNISDKEIPLNRILFVTWGGNDRDLRNVPVGTRQGFLDVILGMVASMGQPAQVSALPSKEHLVILKSVDSEIDDKVQDNNYLWLATSKATDTRFQLANSPTKSIRSVAVYYKQDDGTWLYQASVSWKEEGFFSVSPLPDMTDTALLPVKEFRSWSLRPDAYPLSDNLPLDTEDWCIEDTDDLVLRGKTKEKLYGSPGFEAKKCFISPL